MKCPLATKKVNVKAPPDRWGNKVFEQWAAQNHIPLRQLSPVDKLSLIGKRGMGALEYAPATARRSTQEAHTRRPFYRKRPLIYHTGTSFTLISKSTV